MTSSPKLLAFVLVASACTDEDPERKGPPLPDADAFKVRALSVSETEACVVYGSGDVKCVDDDGLARWIEERGTDVALGFGSSDPLVLLETGEVSATGYPTGGYLDVASAEIADLSLSQSFPHGAQALHEDGRIRDSLGRLYGSRPYEALAGSGCGLVAGTREPGCYALPSFFEVSLAPRGVGFSKLAVGCGILEADSTARCWLDPLIGDVPTEPLADIATVVVPKEMVGACGILSSDQSIVCWGDTPGVDDAIPSGRFIAIELVAVTNFVVSSIGVAACAIREDGLPLCWGEPPLGMMRASASAPVASLALHQNGQMVCMVGAVSKDITCYEPLSSTTYEGPFAAVSFDSEEQAWGLRTDGGLVRLGVTASVGSFSRLENGLALNDAGALFVLGEPAPFEPAAGLVFEDLWGQTKFIDNTICGLTAGAREAVCFNASQSHDQPAKGPPSGVAMASYRVAVASGPSPAHCGITADDRSLDCWGRDVSNPRIAQQPALSGVESILVHERFACAALENGEVACWGDVLPESPPPDLTFENVSLLGGEGYACGIHRILGEVTCWGAVPQWLRSL